MKPATINNKRTMYAFSLGIFSLAAVVLALAPMNVSKADAKSSATNVTKSFNFGGTGDEDFKSVVATPDGGFLLVGNSNAASSNLGDDNWGNAGAIDAIAVKTDKDGKVEWAKNYGGAGNDYFTSVALTSTGDAILVGYTAASSTNLSEKNWTGLGGNDGLVVRIDQEGEVEWAQTFGSNGTDNFQSVTATSSGDFLVVGYSNRKSTSLGEIVWDTAGSADCIAMRIDEDGVVAWAKNYGGTGIDNFQSAVEASDGGFVIAGFAYGASTNLGANNWGYVASVDGIAVKIDEDGNVEWAKNYGGDGLDRFESIIATSDGDFILMGYASAASTNLGDNNWGFIGGNDAIAIRIDIDGKVEWAKNYGGTANENFLSGLVTSDGGIIFVGFSRGASTNLGTANWETESAEFDGIVVKVTATGVVEWTRNCGGLLNEQISDVVATPNGGFFFVGYSDQASTNLGDNNWSIVEKKDGIAILTKGYAITFNGGGGTLVSGTASQNAVQGSSVVAPTYERTGYVFAGFDKTFDSITESMTVTALWTAQTFTITYDYQNATGGNSSPNISVIYDSSYTLAIPIRSGWTFGGWYSEANGGGTQYANASGECLANWTETSDKTLYAKWTEHTVLITYNYQNATGGNESLTFTPVYGSSYTLAVPNRIGYVFGGWYSETDGGGTAYTNASGESLADWTETTGMTLYAKWTAQTYTLTYNYQSATGGNDVLTFTATYDSTNTLAVPTRTGYTFGGWYSQANGGGTQLTDASGVTIGNWTETADMTIYAKWIANKQKITFNANGGEGSMVAQEIESDASANLKSNEFTRKGYNFIGWAENADATEAKYTDKQQIKMGLEGVTLYAVWEKEGLSGGMLAVIIIGSILIVSLGGFAFIRLKNKKKI